MRSYRPEELFDAGGRVDARGRGAGAGRATAAWAPTRTPTAGGCSGRCACPDFRVLRGPRRPTGSGDRRGHPGPRWLPARRDGRQRRSAQLPCRRPGRDGVEPARCAVRGDRAGVAWPSRAGRRRVHLRPDGRVLEILSEHTCQGWLEGYLLTGRHGIFSCYEAFIHLVDSMFNQHAKWLKVSSELAVAARHRLTQLPAHLARVAPGPQRLQPPGPGVHRPGRQQEGRASCACISRPTRTRSSRSPTTACAAATGQRDRRRQAAGAAVPGHGRGRHPLHEGPRHLGVGEQRRRRRSRRGDGVLRRRPDPRDARRRRSAPPARTAPQGAGRQRRGPDDPATRAGASHTACPTATSTRCSASTSP